QGALWIREVEAVRDIRVEWRLFSLFHVQEHHDEFGDDVRDEMTLGLRALALVRREGGNEAIGRAYRVLGERVHGEGRKLTAEECRSALAEGGFDPGLVDRAMADPSTLDEVVAEHEAVVQEVGAFGVPTIVLPDG